MKQELIERDDQVRFCSALFEDFHLISTHASRSLRPDTDQDSTHLEALSLFVYPLARLASM